jgi:alpha-1,3-glucosyltransferase
VDRQATSQWTLDYPPLFAWFEWLLGLPARWLHPALLAVSATPVLDPPTLLYQRLTVIVADLVLLAGVTRCVPLRISRPWEGNG